MFAPDFGGVEFGGFGIQRFEGGKVVGDWQYDDQLQALGVAVGGNNHQAADLPFTRPRHLPIA